jgi:hypothetical protein
MLTWLELSLPKIGSATKQNGPGNRRVTGVFAHRDHANTNSASRLLPGRIGATVAT